MRILSFLIFGLVLMSSVYGQLRSGKIHGTVIDGNSKTVESATITLLRSGDSTLIKMTAADKTGKYEFDGIPEGKYFVSISAVGHQKGYSEQFEVSSVNTAISLKTIELVPQSKAIGGVTVVSRKPLIEQKIDRTIVNVDASASNVGTSALEVLEKSPGVSVDKDGNISLKGKQGVQVYIDGKQTYLSGPDLANMLRNMNSNQLDQIEIMTNPPAKYDAAGNSGIINIKTKKTNQFGYSGNLSSTYSQGRYPKVSEGFNFNYRKNKVNLFTNLGYGYRKNFQNLDIQRKFIEASTKEIKSHFDQESRIMEGGQSFRGKIGLDYYATQKTTLGVVFNGFYNPGTFSNRSQVMIADPSRIPMSITLAATNNDKKWSHFSTNLNFRHVFDSTGREITADLDYLGYQSKNKQDLVNAYYTADWQPMEKADTLLGNLPQDIKIYTGRVDYTQPMQKGAKFDAGLKASIVRTDNNAVYDSVNYGGLVRDNGRTNHFIYEENVNAAYVNYSRPLGKKWSGQLGLRLENTNSNGHSVGKEYDTASNIFVHVNKFFKKNYTQLFPTAYLQYNVNDKHSFVLNYGRRINRPDYEDLNPFILFLDRYTFEQGNPNLQPQFSHNIELKHTYKGFLTTTLNYSKTTDIITEVLEQNTEKNETFVKESNIASQQQFGFSVSGSRPVKKWWTMNFYGNVFKNLYEGIVNGDFIEVGTTTGQFNLSNQFKFGKTWSGELSGFYTTPIVEGVFRIGSFGMMNLGVSKQVLKGKGTLRLSARDILNTQKIGGKIRFSNIDAAFQQTRDSRQVALGFTWRFSKGKLNGNGQKRKAGSADEEKSRVKTGGE